MGKGGRSVAPAPKKEVTKATQYTWAQVKEHITPQDAWMVHNNKVYDVSDW